MKLLLDTHALLWILSDDSRLSKRARSLYQDATDIAFSVVSLWEIGIKLGLNCADFRLREDGWEAIPRTLVSQGVARLELSDWHCREVARLALHHRDPFDRMLVVQAIESGRAILSCDDKLDLYPVRRVW